MSGEYVQLEDLPEVFQAMSYETRYGIVENARRLLDEGDDLSDMNDNDLAFLHAQFPDLMDAIEGLRKARRLLDFEIAATRRPY